MSDRTLAVRYEQEIPDVVQALQGVHKVIDGYGFDRLNRVTGEYDDSGWEPHIQFGRIF